MKIVIEMINTHSRRRRRRCSGGGPTRVSNLSVETVARSLFDSCNYIHLTKDILTAFGASDYAPFFYKDAYPN